MNSAVALPPEDARPSTHLPWVDGLRAIAVVLVIAFHAGYLPGGYLGVDVFFVISGYVVTLSLINRGDVGLRGAISFYLRRLRRLAPALIVVCATAALIAPFLLMPLEFKSFGRVLIGALLWLSNVILYVEQGYFAALARDNPLMHTWSLSVEAQVYFLMPLIAGFGYFSRNVVLFAWATLGALSLTLWFGFGHVEPRATFLLMHFRLWELALGAVLALSLAHVSVPHHVRLVVGFLALVVIIGLALATIPDPYDRWWAVPVAAVATVCLLAMGGGSPVLWTRMLELPVMLFVGLISYSLYLWHQVLFAFARSWTAQEPSAFVYGALTIMSLGLAWLTWRWVEQPCRTWSWPLARARSIAIAGFGFATIACVALGIFADATKGWPNRLTEQQAEVYEVFETRWLGTRVVDCARAETARDGCLNLVVNAPSSPNEPVDVLLMGDSHARVMQEPLRAHFTGDEALEFRTFIASRTCALDEPKTRDRWETVVAHPEIRLVILACRLDALLGHELAGQAPGWRQAPRNSQQMPVFDIGGRINAYRADERQARADDLMDVLTLLSDSGKPVLIVDQVPLLPGSAVKMALATANDGGVPATLALPRTLVEQRHSPTAQALQNFATIPNVERFPTRDHFCDEDGCPAVLEGIPLYFDEDHLSVAGADRIAPQLAQHALAILAQRAVE